MSPLVLLRGVLLALGAVLSLPLPAATAGAAEGGDAARAWQSVSVEAGKRIEIDRASIKRDESGKVSAWGRVVMEKDLPDAQTTGSYRSIEALGRYDCSERTYATLKRIYVKASGERLREETAKVVTDMPVRANTLDDKLLREVCRPSSVSDRRKEAQATVKKAGVAAEALKQANEEVVKKSLQREAAKPAAAEAESLEQMEIRKPAPAARAAVTPGTVEASQPSPRSSRKKAAAAKPHQEVHWAYEGEGGPAFWGGLEPAFSTCAKGQRQSPIDIADGIPVDLPALEFDYRPTRFRIIDNGHTLQVTPGQGSFSLMGKTYRLQQVHFHRPAEERVQGRSFAMVAHLVHRSDDNRLAVVAVLLEPGSEHPLIQTLWNYIPLEKNQELAPPETSIDLTQLLPYDRTYATYMGSLTTPPCTEGVLWMVMRQPVQISPQQIAIFARLYPHNARPIQPTNGRLIKESR